MLKSAIKKSSGGRKKIIYKIRKEIKAHLKNNGILILDNNLEIINLIDESDGLLSSQITSMFIDDNDDMFITNLLSSAKIDFDNSLTEFDRTEGVKGVVTKIRRLNNQIYFSTTEDIFSLKPNNDPFENASINEIGLDDYVRWRRTKNWDRSKHINNPKPPTNMTINTELKDFKGFFDYCIKKKRFTKDIEYPFQKIDYKKSIEKNPSFTDEDWHKIVMYSRTWRNKTTTSKGKLRKNNFYRIVFVEFLKILGNSGMRVHEALLLRWSDIKLQKKVEISSKTGKERDRWIAIIQIAPETKTGRREVICPAGIYLKRLKEFYKKEEGQLPRSDDFVFRNVGTKTSKNAHIGNALSDSFLRRLWYEFREDLYKDKETYFEENYTLHSCRAYYINKRLEFGVKPVFVAKMVGHSIKTMEKHYENIKLRQLTAELVNVKRKEMEESDFQTFDMDFL